MFGVVDVDSLVRQHYGNPLMNSIVLLQTSIVEDLVIGEIKQCSFVNRTSEDLEKTGVEGHSADSTI